jgi:hypothetical protein
MKLDVKAHVHPDVSIEVDDVEEVYERATRLERRSSIP